MREELITYSTAKLAKEKGFDILTEKFWANYYTGEPLTKWKILPRKESSLKFMEWSAPTQSLLQKWLREEHKIEITIQPTFGQKQTYLTFVNRDYVKEVGMELMAKIGAKSGIMLDHKIFDTYEQALETGLQEALKLI